MWCSGIACIVAVAISPAFADVRPSSGESTWILAGRITKADVRAVKAIAASEASRTSKLPTFLLRSEGGDLEAAIEIGRLLRKLSARAIVHKDGCFSSCVLIYAGAVMRFNWGPIGIHRPFSTDIADRPFSDVQRDQRRVASAAKVYLEEMNVSPALFDAMMRIPPESMRVLKKSELEDLGLLTVDPVQQEIMDAAEARKLGLSKIEFLKRKGSVGELCAREERAALTTGDMKSYFECRDRVMRGH